MKSWASEYVGIEKTKTGGSLDYRNHLGSIPPSDQSDIALPHTYAETACISVRHGLKFESRQIQMQRMKAVINAFQLRPIGIVSLPTVTRPYQS